MEENLAASHRLFRRDNGTYDVFAQQAVSTVRTKLGCVIVVARNEAAANGCIIPVAAYQGYAEALQISDQLLPNRHSTRHCFEIEATRMAPFGRFSTFLQETCVDLPAKQELVQCSYPRKHDLPLSRVKWSPSSAVNLRRSMSASAPAAPSAVPKTFCSLYVSFRAYERVGD